MKLDNIFSDSEKDLAPIFSSNMVLITIVNLWVLGIILVLTWPYSPLFEYIQSFRIPHTYLGIFVGSLIMISYMNLRCALGEIIPKGGFARSEREGLTTFEEERDYLSYEFPHSVFHTLVLHLLILPFLIIGAATTGVALPAFFLGLAILFTASLLCRVVSFFFLLVLGRWRLTGYLGARVFYLLFLFATAFFAPFLNPVLLLGNLHYGERVPMGPIISTPLPYFLAVLSALLLFFLVNQWILRHNIRKRSTW
ncbi:MAG: hypothetical protein A2Y79_05480 [Deltaproteobacteria bacterium RBG_13_43_22]|nr:MAG: hypothetical protein A2Y79_05480 [Deltaproteobacteria bacterium RBG_13_43_22]